MGGVALARISDTPCAAMALAGKGLKIYGSNPACQILSGALPGAYGGRGRWCAGCRVVRGASGGHPGLGRR